MTLTQDEIDAEEGLALLMGGLTSDEMKDVVWDETHDETVQIKKEHNNCLKKRESHRKSSQVDISQFFDSPLDPDIIKHAHSIDEQGMVVQPAVKIIDLGERGNGLIVAKSFKKGSIIFTERTLVANSSHIPACCYCWRSLSGPDDVAPKLPQPLLWPVIMTSVQRHDKCGTMFCSVQCLDAHRQTFGDCCRLKKCLQVVPSDDEARAILSLAVVTFVAAVQKYRTNATSRSMGKILDSLCGSSSDITALELDGSLEQMHGELSYLLSLSQEELTVFSSDTLAKYIAMTARNSFGGFTRNPFDAFYAILSRSARSEAINALGGTLTRELDHDIRHMVTVDYAAIFGLTSRINHSCDPNAEVACQGYMDCHVDIVARRDLEEGEELVISYLHKIQRRNRRQRLLHAKYLFWCKCHLCEEEAA
jgi:SET domain